MVTITHAEVLQDQLAQSLATALASANKKARELGVDTTQSRLSIRQVFEDGMIVWKINYGSKDYMQQRGGDVLIEIDASSHQVRRVLRGQ